MVHQSCARSLHDAQAPVCVEPDDIWDIGAALLGELYAGSGLFNLTIAPFLETDSVDNFEVLSVEEIKSLCSIPRKLNEGQSKDANAIPLDPRIVYKSSLVPPVLDRATCPWRYTKNTDPGRIPVHIAEATCVCETCAPQFEHSTLNNNFLLRHQAGRSRHSLRHRSEGLHTGKCRPIEAETAVLKKRCNRATGKFEYKVEIEYIAVGCHCTRA